MAAGKKPASKPSINTKKRVGFTKEEQEAMKDHLREINDEVTQGEGAVLGKIAGMPEPDRSLGRRLHAVIMASAEGLAPRLWYGMPAYSKDGKVLCYFQPSQKFKTRYSTLGFSDKATLDEGRLWPTVFAVKELTPAEEAKIGALVKRAAG